ncbi:uncharacterized protein LOC127747698 [Arachis duranensis]|uniref:Uncharacterized protein LOC127747698 n=1 Tax=Arachis duranensis TaxID=130453 RepID=A0A9C6TK12_ARADU|nr:uncharacterized protein LOC127747698 [Arachis duranensis]
MATQIGDSLAGDTTDGKSIVHIPSGILVKNSETTLDDLVNFDKAILAPTLDCVTDVNNKMTEGYLDTKEPTTTKLIVKVGAPIMLLRIINQTNGLCNGTRTQVAAVSESIEQLYEKVSVKGNCSSQIKDEYYLHLVRAVYSTLNYIVPENDEEDEEDVSLTPGGDFVKIDLVDQNGIIVPLLRLKVQILISTAISNDEDNFIELDKRSSIPDDAFNIKINMNKPVSPTIRVATREKNISKSMKYCLDEIKDKDYVAKQIRAVIREVGLSNVVQIMTDSASICKV